MPSIKQLILPILIACFSLLNVTAFVFAQSDQQLLDQLISGIETTYSNKGFSADFNQLSRLNALDITEKASGKAFFSHPGKMKWEYRSPDVHQVITNGRTLWIYKPDENQVIQGNADRLFKSGAGGGFLSDISMIRKHFEIKLKEANEQSVQIDMVSRTQNPDIASIVLTVDRKTFEITQVVTYNMYDDATRFDFSNIRFDQFDDSLFEFVPPAKSDVIQMSE
ncbi:MAG: outer membrane lipoprotein carrier protein LolA [Desulfobacteraceae bacterium]|nr:MAG: outer membrane lipoprotein carrier protein LolA [Desulfobacteraceae bacterium]